MNRLYPCMVFIIGISALPLKSQHYWDLAFQASRSAYTNWNQSLNYFNESRFWQEKPLNPLEWSRGASVCYSGVLSRGFFISPQFSYFDLTSEGSAARIAIRNYSAQVGFDVFPLEFKLDSVAYTLRPFARFAGGGDLFRPTIYLSNGPATIMDKPYNPYCWSYRLEAGLGLRIRITEVLGFHILGGYRFSKVILDNFHTALNGVKWSTASEAETINAVYMQAGITFRTH